MNQKIDEKKHPLQIVLEKLTQDTDYCLKHLCHELIQSSPCPENIDNDEFKEFQGLLPSVLGLEESEVKEFTSRDYAVRISAYLEILANCKIDKQNAKIMWSSLKKIKPKLGMGLLDDHKLLEYVYSKLIIILDVKPSKI